MSDRIQGPDTQPLLSAGAMIRAARQAQGLHLAALATQLKITPRKLEALEADRFEELQGPTFVRALAQATCRALKIDPVPVLARLPQMQLSALEQVSGGLNAPFREHGATRAPLEWFHANRRALMVVAVLLVGAVLLWLAPPGFGLSHLLSDAHRMGGIVSAAAADPADTAASDPVMPSDQTNAATVADRTEPEAPAAAVPVAASGIPVQVLVREASWVEVTDAGGHSLIARTLTAGEAVGLDGALPLRVKIGNAAATDVQFRGVPVDIRPMTKDNVARFELK
jgi:cytoskeleton protein RodZ